MNNDVFLREYSSPDAIKKYTRATAGYGISYLLDHDYKQIYLDAVRRLPAVAEKRPIRVLEFGCGGGMNLLHLVATLGNEGVEVASAVGSDFSPVLIAAAQEEADKWLDGRHRAKVRFCYANNETLVADLAAELKMDAAALEGSFDFVFGVNTIRYTHRSGKQDDCARDIYRLLAPGGVCVVIDMNDRFPAFRSALKEKVQGRKPAEETYLPSLDAYAAPFEATGFELLRKENFCWVAHSAGPVLGRTLRVVSPVLNAVARPRSMRSLVVARKPARTSARPRPADK